MGYGMAGWQGDGLIPMRAKKPRGVSLNPEVFHAAKEYGVGGPSRSAARAARNQSGYAAADHGSFGVTPKATADWGTIDAASLDPFPRGVTAESQIAANAASKSAPNPTGVTGATDGFVSFEGGYQPQPSVGNTGIKTFGSTASDEYYFNLVNALSGNQYNRELLGQGLAYGLDRQDESRIRGERPIWDRLNQRNVVNSGIADQTLGEYESDQLRSIGDMLRQYDLSAQQLNIGGDLAQEQQYYRGIDSDALADALGVAATTANISDPNELRASIAQQIRSLQ